MASFGRLFSLPLLILALISPKSAVAQSQDFLFYRKQLGHVPYADSIPQDTVFAFGGYVQLRGSIAHYESFFDDDDTKRLYERWLGPRVQDISYKISGSNIQLKAAQSMDGLILENDSINWSQLNKKAVQFVVIPFRLPDKIKSFKGAWSLTGSRNNRAIIEFGGEHHRFEPYFQRQEGFTEFPDDKLVLPAGVTLIVLEDGSKIMSTISGMLSLHWDKKQKLFAVEGFPREFDKGTKYSRFAGIFEKLTQPPRSVITELEQRLHGSWVSVGTSRKKSVTGEAVPFGRQYSLHIDGKIIRVVGFENNADNFERTWRLSRSGRLLIMDSGSFVNYYAWSFSFEEDTLIVKLPLGWGSGYYLEEIRFVKK